MRLFAPLYRRVLEWSVHPHAERYLALMSFAESSFFPVPPDVMLAPMCLAERRRAWRFAAVTTIASLLGGLLGYALGFFLFDAIEPWLEASRYWEPYLLGRAWFDQWGIWAVFVAGFSPIPYKIFTIASGVTELNLPVFVAASALSRGARFFLLAALLWYFGPPIRRFIEENLPALALGFCVLLLGGFVAIRYLL